MIALTSDPAQTRRTIELIWLAQDIDATIEIARAEMTAFEFDWRGVGAGKPRWKDIRRAMITWALHHPTSSGETNDVGNRDHAARRNAATSAPAQVGDASSRVVFKSGPLPSVPADHRAPRGPIPRMGV